MICRYCQNEVVSDANYCSRCGARQSPANGRHQLLRSRLNTKLGGVCGGLGEYFDVDPTMVRVLWVVLSVVPGCLVGGLLAYLALWVIIPRAPASTAPGMAFSAPAKTS